MTVESPVLTVVPWERAGRPMGQHRSTGEMELCHPTISFLASSSPLRFPPFFKLRSWILLCSCAYPRAGRPLPSVQRGAQEDSCR